MAKARKSNPKKQAMLVALEKSLGVVTTACRMADINRATFYTWYNDDPEFKDAVDEINEVALDFAESKLHQKIGGVKVLKKTKDEDTVYLQPPSDTAIIFYLKTKGKKRGYIENLNHEVFVKEFPVITLAVPTPDEIEEFHSRG